MKTLLNRLWTEEEGQDLAEYVLLLALLALAAITTIGTIASTINAIFLNEASTLGNASGG
jgi:Flp pilus assembly pilin Flp